jgi:hypothetical protein
LIGMRVITVGSGNYTPASDVTRIHAILTGGGGSGGRGTASGGSTTSAGGGGAGGSAEFVADVVPGTPYAYVVGAGGTWPGAINTNGNAGANSTFLGRVGGGGGGGEVVGPAATAVTGFYTRYGGISGVATGVAGDLLQPGNAGAPGVQLTGNQHAWGGQGGASRWSGVNRAGLFATGNTGTQFSFPPLSYGVGGAGTTGAFAGGNGGDGVLVIWEYGASGGGGGAVSSVFGRTGAVVAVAGDYDSDEVTNASTVVGVTVSDALDTIEGVITTIISTIGSLLASMIGNDSAVPGATVRDALNAIGGIINILTTGFVGPLANLRDFIITNYTTGADPFVGATGVTLTVAYMPNAFNGSFQTIAGNNDGATPGGVGISLFQNTILLQAWDAGGTQRTLFYNVPSTNFICIVTATIDTSGADMLMTIYLNGSRVAEATEAGGGGALPAGSFFTLGSKPGGADMASACDIIGTGYRVGIATAAEIAGQFGITRTGGTFGDLPVTPFDAAWQIVGADPGTPWASFVGAVDLVRSGPAIAYQNGGPPLFR